MSIPEFTNEHTFGEMFEGKVWKDVSKKNIEWDDGKGKMKKLSMLFEWVYLLLRGLLL